MVSTKYIRQKSQSLNLVDRIAKRESAFPIANRSPNLWTRAYIDSTLDHSPIFYYKDLFGHFGCVNSVEFSPDGVLLASGGDDKRILLWHVWQAVYQPKYVPMEMKSGHNSNIFCISFDSTQKRIFSGGNDELVIIHNIETKEAIDVISHMDDVYDISVDPFNNNIFASASNDAVLWDIRSPNAKSTQLAIGSEPFHSLMYAPTDSNILVTANSKDGIAVYDARKPMHKLLHFYSTSIMNSQSAMCVRFNRTGNLILALRRRLSPVLYDIRSPYPLVEFDSEDYYNSCTLKSCCFCGEDDQFVASGSDNFKIFLWKIPDDVFNDSSSKSPLKLNSVNHVPQARQILNGHRSIVNQVRFNEKNGMIASTGVEKVIKLWSPIVQFDEKHKVNSQESNLDTPVRRNVFTYQDYLDLVHNDRFYVPHDYSGNNIGEDRRMIAYFDSMIERDITGSTWLSSSEDESPSYFNYIMKHELDYTEHLKSFALDPEENCEMSYRDISTDSEEKLAVQQRFDFTKSFETNKFDEDNYLAYVFAKRMHARYLTSYVNNLIGQIEKLNCDKSDNLGNDSLRPQTSETSSRKGGQSSRTSESNGHGSGSIGQSSTSSSDLLDSSNINQKIKTKKENALIFFAYKFSKSLLLSFHFGTLYDMSKNKLLQQTIDESKELNNSKSKMHAQIKMMSKLKAKNLCDKRLFNILNTLYKRVLHLLNLLNDSHYDIKAKCEDFIRNLKPRSFRRQLFIANLVDYSDDSDSEIEIEDEHEEDVVMGDILEDSEEGESDSDMVSSSTTLSSSDSSSSSDTSDGEKKAETEKDHTCKEVDLSKLSCEDDTQAPAIHPEMGPSTSAEQQSTSKGIFFKKINRKNKSYKQRPQRKHRKVCKNKRQRKS